jgi:hypothetical protein|tara:strand:+ start:174 stop:461 length:288 start_codon:yes stop_codon:yes gene_type:complete
MSREMLGYHQITHFTRLEVQQAASLTFENPSMRDELEHQADGSISLWLELGQHLAFAGDNDACTHFATDKNTFATLFQDTLTALATKASQADNSK